MLIFDQLKKNDPQLRALALIVLGGLGLLLAGLWWVQIVSARDYQANLENQSFRTVRIPAVRGKILDRNGIALAENQPTYNVSLYLEELRKPFDAAYFEGIARTRDQRQQQLEAREQALGRKLSKQERRVYRLTSKDKELLRQKARYAVASNVVAQVSQRLQQPLSLDPTHFERHYETRLALPLQLLSNATPVQIARFEEQSTSPLGMDLEVQTTRVYPYGTTAAHLLGHLQRDDSSAEGEDAFFSYRLPDYRGVIGLEFGYDKQLRGMAGAKSVLVNNVGYRQTENVWSPAEPGQNLVLTIDLAIQRASERALAVFGPATRGAAVVMDVQTGDILAMASSPSFDPNYFTQGFPRGEWQRITDLQAEKNRATQENYAPGSIFKVVVGLAALEAGLNPKQQFNIAADPQRPDHGIIYVGGHPFHDLAPPGEHDFRSALKLSSNSYFITNGLWTGVANIVRLGQRLHLGQGAGLPTRQDARGAFPSLQRVRSGWFDGNTANMCIGQDPVQVTPLQMAVMTAAIANGGTVLWPRLVDRLEPQDSAAGEEALLFPPRPPRDHLGVKPANLEILREAMLADVEDPDGTGRAAALPGLRICGKTGTAQVKDEHGQTIGHNVWFISFAPYETPRCAVVVMVQVASGGSGGATCAPIARKIYSALLERERRPTPKGANLAHN